MTGCAVEVETRQVWQASTVEEWVDTSCSTAVVLELSLQIAEEVDCLMPGQLVPLEEGSGIVFTGAAVLPYMDEEARTDLLAAAAENAPIELNSAYRTVAQQYLLYRWFEAGRCGITAAAQPGESNHESGRAIDVNNWPEMRASLEAHGWAQTVPGDEVHFDHLASPDIRGSDILAFQRLWNRNHPMTPIDEDGFWGPMTESALASAPAEGFEIGASCDDGGGDDDPGPDGGGDPNPGGGGDDPGGLVGGCATGGGDAGALLLVGLLLSAAGARRRSARSRR
jgi:MYXO-CTERM domain-containing protein